MATLEFDDYSSKSTTFVVRHSSLKKFIYQISFFFFPLGKKKRKKDQYKRLRRPCKYCMKCYPALPRHLVDVHYSEEDVIAYLNCKDKKIKRRLMAKIRNEGIMRQNDARLAAGITKLDSIFQYFSSSYLTSYLLFFDIFC